MTLARYTLRAVLFPDRGAERQRPADKVVDEIRQSLDDSVIRPGTPGAVAHSSARRFCSIALFAGEKY